MLRVQCPKCGAGIRAPAEKVGREAKCPKCKTPFTIQVPDDSSPTAEELGGFRPRKQLTLVPEAPLRPAPISYGMPQAPGLAAGPATPAVPPGYVIAGVVGEDDDTEEEESSNVTGYVALIIGCGALLILAAIALPLLVSLGKWGMEEAQKAEQERAAREAQARFQANVNEQMKAMVDRNLPNANPVVNRFNPGMPNNAFPQPPLIQIPPAAPPGMNPAPQAAQRAAHGIQRDGLEDDATQRRAEADARRKAWKAESEARDKQWREDVRRRRFGDLTEERVLQRILDRSLLRESVPIKDAAHVYFSYPTAEEARAAAKAGPEKYKMKIEKLLATGRAGICDPDTVVRVTGLDGRQVNQGKEVILKGSPSSGKYFFRDIWFFVSDIDFPTTEESDESE